jgi:formylglycine-generating enzyme required for sulfatase activity/tetratricopeptide (TPR) repeat protein
MRIELSALLVAALLLPPVLVAAYWQESIDGGNANKKPGNANKKLGNANRTIAARGTLIVETDPPDAIVSISTSGGKLMRRLKLSNNGRHQEKLPPGKYVAVVSAPNHVTYKQEITIKANEVDRVTANLAVAAGEGSATIAAQPPPEPVIAVPVRLTDYRFDTAKVTRSGQWGDMVERRKGQAQYFVEDLRGDATLEMVRISAGTFMMGSPNSENGRDDDEGPQHWVTVSEFYMGKFEVSQGQWRAVAKMPKVSMDLNPDPSSLKGDDLPVDHVSWDDAMEFCARLSRATGRGYRLPSEAEWEYACRAGTTTPFSFGETPTSKLANYDGRNGPYGSSPLGLYRGRTVTVGSLGVANEFGLYDMHGNISEWCMDNWHQNYYGAPDNGTVWEGGDSTLRVLRGGSWFEVGSYCRSARRDRLDHGYLSGFSGFRVALAGGTSASAPEGGTAAAYTQRGDFLAHAGRWADAELEYRHAEQVDANDVVTQFKLAVSLSRQHKFEEAGTEYTKITQTHGWPLIEGHYRQVMSGHVETAEYHGAIGTALRFQARLAESEAEIREAIRLDQNNGIYHYELGTVLHRRNNLAEAEAEYRAGISLDPGLAAAHSALGTLLNAQKKYSEGETEFREAIRLEPNLWVAHFGLGTVLRERREYREAEAEFRDAVKINPSFVPGHTSLGLVLFDEQRYSDSEIEFREVIRLSPGLSFAHDNLGAALDHQQKYVEAESEFRTAIGIDPKLSHAHCNLGNALQHQSRLREAEAEYREALRLDPNNSQAQQELTRLAGKK